MDCEAMSTSINFPDIDLNCLNIEHRTDDGGKHDVRDDMMRMGLTYMSSSGSQTFNTITEVVASVALKILHAMWNNQHKLICYFLRSRRFPQLYVMA